MAWCLPEAGDDGDDGEKGFALSRVVKRIIHLGEKLGHGLAHVRTSFHSWKSLHSCSARCGTVLIRSMSNTPSAKAILQLYASMLRTSRSFSSYNFREYFIRRTKTTFREIQVCYVP